MCQLTLRLVEFSDKANVASTVALSVSLFGFLGNVMIDYNWGSNPITSSIAVAYWWTLRWMIPFPLNYWGLGAFLYFLVFLISFAALNRAEPLFSNLLQTIRLGSLLLVLFEVGVYYFVPDFMGKWVVNAVRGTTLAFFTNWDLLACSIAAMGLSQAMLSRWSKFAQ